MSAPRASTEEENAPLLADNEANQHPIFRASRPMTTLEKILSISVLALLLIASTFVGLFAGTNSQLSKEKHRPARTVTTTIGRHATATATRTGQAPFPAPTKTPSEDKKICLTKDCVLLASEILNSIDESADPCEDFYAFANGGFLSTNSIPADRSAWGNFDVAAQNNQRVLQAVLDSDEVPSGPKDDAEVQAEIANLKKWRTGYRACLDVEAIDKRGLKPLLDLVNEVTDILGPFDVIRPLTGESADTSVDWAGAWTEDYAIPEDLVVREEVLERLSTPRESAPRMASDPRAGDEVTVLELDLDEQQVAIMESRKEKMTQAVAFAHSRSVDALFGFLLEGDSSGNDSQIQSLFFYQTSGGLPAKQYYEEKPIVDLYTHVVSSILEAVGTAQSGRADAASTGWPKWPAGGGKDQDSSDGEMDLGWKVLAQKVVAFERELIRAGGDPELLSNPLYANNPFAFQNLSKAMPFIGLNEYISAFAPRNHPDKVIVTYPAYLKSLSHLLAKTPDHVLSAYFVTRFSLRYGGLLGPRTQVWQAVRTLQETLGGLKKGTPQDRNQYCLRVVDELEGLGLLGGKEFVDRAFSGDSRQVAEDIITGVIDAFKARMHSLSWMDRKSADAAIRKAETLRVKIGYPTTPNVTDAISLQRYFSRLEITDDLFANELNVRMLDEIRSWSTLGMARDRGSWLMVPQLVNAYYSPPDGEIVFPAGFLQRPWFSASWPAHLNFGAFGAVAAHELTHAFDNQGAQYDENGLLRDWWTKSTVKAFNEKAQCIAKQYSEYSITGPDGKQYYINGNLTNGEDLGDSGITFAFSAWKEHVKGKSAEKTYLPGLDYTEEQLFFIASGRLWAQLIKPEAALVRLRTDPHSPNKWRSNGQLRGFDEFAKAFKCKAGTPMNPQERCNVWKAT